MRETAMDTAKDMGTTKRLGTSWTGTLRSALSPLTEWKSFGSRHRRHCRCIQTRKQKWISFSAHASRRFLAIDLQKS